MKESVIIERYDTSDRVCVLPYDRDNKLVLGDMLEVLSRQEALDFYDVVGEIIGGEIRMFTDDYEDEEYDYFDEEDDEA